MDHVQRKIGLCRALLVGVTGALLQCVPTHAAIIHEDFSSDPQNRGWRVFGDTNSFRWSSANQNLKVTWNSSKANSYFRLPLQTILTRADDFTIGFDLE